MKLSEKIEKRKREFKESSRRFLIEIFNDPKDWDDAIEKHRKKSSKPEDSQA